MADIPEVHGTVEEGFEPVREAFVRNFLDHGEIGASCAVTVEGRMVVDLWAGTADVEGARPWHADTIVNVYSATKGLTALCAHILADQGKLDLDAPVAEYWPEFGRAGKQTMPVRYLLSHQAGLPVVDEKLPDNAALDWERMVGALERQEPIWTPGERHGYHAITYGWLVGEVVRRVSGAESFGAFLSEAVVEPLGIDFFVGTPATEHHRVANLSRDDVVEPLGADILTAPTDELSEAKAMREGIKAIFSPGSLPVRVMGLISPPIAPLNNDPRWREAQIPAANGHGNARALARVYGALAVGGTIDGVQLLSPGAVKLAAAEQMDGPDAVFGGRSRRSLGYMLVVPGQPDTRGPASFGHTGGGGSLGYADPDRGIGFGYAMNMTWSMQAYMNPDPRAQLLAAAVYKSLGG